MAKWVKFMKDRDGQAAQATVIDLSDYRSPDGLDSNATSATLFSQLEAGSDLRFHHLHGRNARISNTGARPARGGEPGKRRAGRRPGAADGKLQKGQRGAGGGPP